MRTKLGQVAMKETEGGCMIVCMDISMCIMDQVGKAGNGNSDGPVL